MSISRWDPWGDLISLREAMNNLLEESYVRPRPGGGGSGVAGLAVDVRETGDNFVITASVPGVRPEHVDITILGDTLRIRGEHKAETERQEGQGEQGRWLIRERRAGAFERTIGLPATVKADAANAEFRDGILTITLPKADEAKPRTIPVRGASGGDAQAIDVNAANGEVSSQQ
jgi:HSP20 family protein